MDDKVAIKITRKIEVRWKMYVLLAAGIIAKIFL